MRTDSEKLLIKSSRIWTFINLSVISHYHQIVSQSIANRYLGLSIIQRDLLKDIKLG